MNKANVFLLVVVSSLLTYISTATQSAATAAVAQEKWEYGKSSVVERDGEVGVQFVGPNYQVFYATYDEVTKTVTRVGPSTSVTKKFNDVNPGDEVGYFILFWESLGLQGWQPYQVIEAGGSAGSKDGGTYGQCLDRIYWRRRVQ